ncbi:hypothetical protein ACFLXI_04935 [Chloroflexota bacterium]
MRRASLLSISLLGLSGCGRLSSIPYSPEQTPESWLRLQPFEDITIGTVDFILVQPSSTVFVYLLGIITIGVGLYFFQIQDNYQSRKWWGFALLLWGFGALFAGTSYQAFSYEIKCVGQALCSWTSWWEIIYLVLSAASIDAMLVSGAYSSCSGKCRKVLMYYAILNIALYSLLVIIGAFSLNKFLISFELLLIVSAPSILILLILNGWRYFQYRDSKDLALLITWLWLGLIIGAYFIYLVLGITDGLWERGIWFSENDVLHIGLISWMAYIAVYVAKRITDEPNPELIS